MLVCDCELSQIANGQPSRARMNMRCIQEGSTANTKYTPSKKNPGKGVDLTTWDIHTTICKWLGSNKYAASDTGQLATGHQFSCLLVCGVCGLAGASKLHSLCIHTFHRPSPPCECQDIKKACTVDLHPIQLNFPWSGWNVWACWCRKSSMLLTFTPSIGPALPVNAKSVELTWTS